MTNSKIRNFLKPYDQSKKMNYFHMYSFKWKSSEVIVLQTDQIYLTFERYILSVRMFIFVLTIYFMLCKKTFETKNALFSYCEKLRKIKKQNKKHL